LNDPATLQERKAIWDQEVAANGGFHPSAGLADTRLLHRARHTAVPASLGAGLHPNREFWVRNPREAVQSGFAPRNKFRP
jgi:dihydroxy-acid dehydratase